MQGPVYWKRLWFSHPCFLSESICGVSCCHHKKCPVSLGGSSRVSKGDGNLAWIYLFLPFILIHKNFYNSRTNDCSNTLIRFQKSCIIKRTNPYTWVRDVTWVNRWHLFPFRGMSSLSSGTAFVPWVLSSTQQHPALKRVGKHVLSWVWNYPFSSTETTSTYGGCWVRGRQKWPHASLPVPKEHCQLLSWLSEL